MNQVLLVKILSVINGKWHFLRMPFFHFIDKIHFVFNANVTMYGAKLGYALASAKSCAHSGFN